MHDPTTRLTDLGEAGKTGILQIVPTAGSQSDVFLMGGEIIACNTVRDAEHLAALLVAAGALDSDAMAATLEGLDGGEDLADTLVASGAVDGAQVMEARATLFRDNIAWALVPAETGTDFEEQDAVFPANMQFGLDRIEVLGDVASWKERIVAVAAQIGSEELWSRGAKRPPGCDKQTWADLAEARTIDALLELLPPPRREAAEKLALWLQMEALVAVSDEPDEPATELPEEDDHGGDDYAKAAAGGFIKSYEVLDKVDLSGMEVVGEAAIASSGSMEAIEAVDFDDADEYDTHPDAEAPDGDVPRDTRPVVASLSFAEGGDLESGDFEVFDAGSEDADLVVDDISSESIAAISLEDDDDAGASASIDIDDLDTPFTREQLNEFHERISVFNNIFRIVFETFAEHITPDKALQRFNALLGSGQRQYPALFKELAVELDGTIAPSALINNLAACPPGDYGSLLHQGLYELIFSHLYDAKDMLPGDAEMQMMERIVVFERQLHQM